MKRTALLGVSILALGAASLSAQAARPAAPPAARPAAGTTIRVRMTQTGTHYMFEPANFTVKVGDVVEFVNVSGFPHNVGFEATKIPTGAADVLNRNMTSRMQSLLGPMMTQANQTYRVSFAGAPVGTYEYFCLPHKALGMKGVITVQAAGAAPARR
jgi:plastocyanin